MRLVLKWLIIAVVLVIGLIYAIQDRLIYHSRGYGIGEENAAQPMVKLNYDIDGLHEVAFYVPPAGGGRMHRLWIMFGGNGAVILQYRAGLPAQRALADDAFLLVDYPGYGDSEGHPSSGAIQESANGALQALATQLNTTIKSFPLGVFGHSLGTGRRAGICRRASGSHSYRAGRALYQPLRYGVSFGRADCVAAAS